MMHTTPPPPPPKKENQPTIKQTKTKQKDDVDEKKSPHWNEVI